MIQTLFGSVQQEPNLLDRLKAGIQKTRSGLVDRLEDAIAANPQYPMLVYNLACSESLSGRSAEAIDHLRRAVGASEKLRADAREDSDFDPIRDQPAFGDLVGQSRHGQEDT